MSDPQSNDASKVLAELQEKRALLQEEFEKSCLGLSKSTRWFLRSKRPLLLFGLLALVLLGTGYGMLLAGAETGETYIFLRTIGLILAPIMLLILGWAVGAGYYGLAMHDIAVALPLWGWDVENIKDATESLAPQRSSQSR